MDDSIRRRSTDPTGRAAEFYELQPDFPDDVAFYRRRVPGDDARVLELGCGTGRVLVPLAGSCAYVHGIDRSEAMLELCRRKISAAGIPPEKARAESGDAARFDLGRRFDLITAPYRVFQSLETDAEVAGMFRCARSHLAPEGSCILSAFNPYLDREAIRSEWCTTTERPTWEVHREGKRITCHDRRPRMDPVRLVLYPELVFRVHEGGEVTDEVVLPIVMRCYYPDDFQRVVEDHGFRVLKRWGGYEGEAYGEGPELVLEIAPRG